MWELCGRLSEPRTVQLTVLCGRGHLANLSSVDLHSLPSKASLHSKMSSQEGLLRFADTFRSPWIKTGCRVVFGNVWKNPSRPLCLCKLSRRVDCRVNAHVLYVRMEPVNKYLCLKLASVKAGRFLVPDHPQAKEILLDWRVKVISLTKPTMTVSLYPHLPRKDGKI